MKYANHGYIGYNASGGPRGVIRPGDLYLRSMPTPISPESLQTLDPPIQLLQAATLVFSNSLRFDVDYSIPPASDTTEVSPSVP
jgi:hypothetical protein